ncbi:MULTISPECIES: DUF2156 domain-containing protein [Parachlamydia]|jgi:hypothetical protein|uniref:Phosphatidylglycerol lysyltransferase C-terminal domain-containing protein n=2 Tax=Parachlamydia acanthamoebae TaxID=83552 RepID=F8KV27_PARAV|nr:DUF2156 domain-containing protein [Parachlamydia acanthamoebae]EFB41206.1 hypothetical protein pah_c048o023 [Parachlamydia acanthamoebae str. Hall's coccus]CCB85100.1 putative uncharacterized protein [Parachlamydia acanthamoebae UV-7]
MSWSPLALEHQSILDSQWKTLCQQNGIVLSEYSFPNNFLFRKQHAYEVKHIDNLVLVRGVSRSGENFLIPTFHPDRLSKERILELLKIAPLFPIPDQWLDCFKDFPVQARYNRDQSDYLFSVDKLKTLPGRKLSSRRNLLHQLTQEHEVHTESFCECDYTDALQVLEKWQKQSSFPADETDFYPCQEALKHLKPFQFMGRMCYVDGAPVAFTIGEKLTPSTAILHFSKALHAIKGLTPFLYEDFAAHLSEDTLWINLEQDLGIPSLRQAKEAYEPDQLVNKWWISLV